MSNLRLIIFVIRGKYQIKIKGCASWKHVTLWTKFLAVLRQTQVTTNKFAGNIHFATCAQYWKSRSRAILFGMTQPSRRPPFACARCSFGICRIQARRCARWRIDAFSKDAEILRCVDQVHHIYTLPRNAWRAQ